MRFYIWGFFVGQGFYIAGWVCTIILLFTDLLDGKALIVATGLSFLFGTGFILSSLVNYIWVRSRKRVNV